MQVGRPFTWIQAVPKPRRVQKITRALVVPILLAFALGGASSAQELPLQASILQQYFAGGWLIFFRTQRFL